MLEQYNDKYVGIEEAAEYLGIKTSTIRTWIKEKSMPAHRVGKMWKFKLSEIDCWVQSGKSANENLSEKGKGEAI